MAAFVLGDQARHEGPHGIDGAAKIDAEAEIPIVIGRVLRRAAQEDAGIADQDMDLARFVRGAREGRAVGDVEANGPHPISTAQRLDRLVERLLADIRDHDARTGVQQLLRDGEADAGAAAGDEGRLVLEVVHGCFSPMTSRRQRCRHRHAGSRH